MKTIHSPGRRDKLPKVGCFLRGLSDPYIVLGDWNAPPEVMQQKWVGRVANTTIVAGEATTTTTTTTTTGF